jgi:hypothetical protein
LFTHIRLKSSERYGQRIGGRKRDQQDQCDRPPELDRMVKPFVKFLLAERRATKFQVAAASIAANNNKPGPTIFNTASSEIDLTSEHHPKNAFSLPNDSTFNVSCALANNDQDSTVIPIRALTGHGFGAVTAGDHPIAVKNYDSNSRTTGDWWITWFCWLCCGYACLEEVADHEGNRT